MNFVEHKKGNNNKFIKYFDNRAENGVRPLALIRKNQGVMLQTTQDIKIIMNHCL